MGWFPHRHDDRYVEKASQLWSQVVSRLGTEAITQDVIDDINTEVNTKLSQATAEGLFAEIAVGERLSTQRYDIREFGTLGTDDGIVLSDAIDAIALAGGGTLTGPKDVYTILTGYELVDGVYLDFPEGTVFDYSGLTTPINNCAAYGEGSITALPTLSTSIAKHARSITFDSAPAVVPGDRLVIYDSTDGSFNAARTYYRAGEFVRVQSVAGNVVTLTAPTYAAYTDDGTVTVYAVNPIRTGITGVTRICPAGFTGEKVVWGADLRFSGRYSGSGVSHLTLARCVDVHLDELNAYHNTDAGGLGYGVTISNCQNVTLTSPFLDTARHGLTLGGEDVVGSIPNRNVVSQGGMINGQNTGASVCGLNMHGNVEDCAFLDVYAPRGVTLAGDRTRLSGRIRTGPEGRAVHFAEMLGWSHDLDVDVEVTAGHLVDQAVIFAQGLDDLVRTDGLLRIRASIDMGAYEAASGATRAIYVYNIDGAPQNDVDIDVDARSSLPDLAAANAFAVHLRANTGGGFRDVKIKARGTRMGAWINCSPRTADIACDFYEPPNVGVRVIPITTPFYAGSIIRDRSRVRRAGGTGIYLQTASSSDGRIICDGSEALDCDRLTTGTSTTGTSIFLQNAEHVTYRNAVIGDTQGVPTQNNADAVHGVGTLVESDITILGTVLGRSRGTITTYDYQGSGTAAPTIAVADGSTYRRIGGGAGTSFYVREAAAWVAK